MYKSILPISCTVFFFSSYIYAEKISFYQLATEILNKNSSVEISELSLMQKNSEISASKWALYPKLSLNSSRTFYPSNLSSRSRSSTSLNANVNIFDGMKSWNSLKIANIDAHKTEIDLKVTKLEILNQVAITYLNWQKGIQKMEVAQALHDVREDMKYSIDESVKLGTRSNIDQILFQNLLLQAKERLARTRIEVKQASIGIQSLLEDAEKSYIDILPQESQLFSIDYCNKNLVASNHPSVKSLSTQSELFTTERSAAMGSYYPSIDLSAEKSFDRESGNEEPDRETIRLSFTWDLFTGFSTKFERADIAYEIQKVDVRKKALTSELLLVQLENCERLKMERDLEQRTRQVVENFEKLLQTSRAQYRNGGISALDLTDQELRFLDAKLDLIDSHFSQQSIFASQWILHGGSLEAVKNIK